MKRKKLIAMKRVRQTRGLTQREVAAKLGIATHSYARYECGMRRPNLDTIFKIADILGANASELLDEQSKKTNKK